MSLMTTVSRAVRGGRREIPTWSMPVIIDITKCKPLGEHRGRSWYHWPEMDLELEVIGEPIRDDDPAVPSGPMYRLERDGRIDLQVLKPYLPGALAALGAVVTRSPKPPAAQRPVDALNAASLLTGHGGAGRYSFRGCAEIVARFRAKGINFRPVGEGSDVLVTAPGGMLTTAHRAEVMLVTPLLVPYLLTGSAPHCEVSRHREPVEAVTLAVAIRPRSRGAWSACRHEREQVADDPSRHHRRRDAATGRGLPAADARSPAPPQARPGASQGQPARPAQRCRLAAGAGPVRRASSSRRRGSTQVQAAMSGVVLLKKVPANNRPLPHIHTQNP